MSVLSSSDRGESNACWISGELGSAWTTPSVELPAVGSLFGVALTAVSAVLVIGSCVVACSAGVSQCEAEAAASRDN